MVHSGAEETSEITFVCHSSSKAVSSCAHRKLFYRLTLFRAKIKAANAHRDEFMLSLQQLI